MEENTWAKAWLKHSGCAICICNFWYVNILMFRPCWSHIIFLPFFFGIYAISWNYSRSGKIPTTCKKVIECCLNFEMQLSKERNYKRPLNTFKIALPELRLSNLGVSRNLTNIHQDTFNKNMFPLFILHAFTKKGLRGRQIFTIHAIVTWWSVMKINSTCAIRECRQIW